MVSRTRVFLVAGCLATGLGAAAAVSGFAEEVKHCGSPFDCWYKDECPGGCVPYSCWSDPCGWLYYPDPKVCEICPGSN